MSTVGEILKYLEEFAPYELSESWDNCGLMVGDTSTQVTKVICALDVTENVVAEAIQANAQLIVAHHPLIFTKINRVTSDNTVGRMIASAIVNNISIICMHTNADCAWGGVNDALAASLNLKNVVSMQAGDNAMLGRVGDLETPMKPLDFALYVKQCLNANGVRFVDGKNDITRVAVGGGACGKMMDFAIKQGATAFVIGDSSYDLMQKAETLGLTLCDAGHFPTENGIAKVFADKINEQFNDIEALVSKIHDDCIKFV